MAVITVSRQYGSQGDEVAARLCELLGYRYFDKRLMAQMASAAGLSAQEIIDSQEDRHHVLSLAERIFGHKVTEAWVAKDEASGARTVEVGELDGKRYVTMVRSLIQAACAQGNVVILGRGGQAVLAGEPGALHIRIEAPFEERARRVGAQQKIWTIEAAREFVASRDRAGADYLRSYYNVDWADPALYHAVLNTGFWGVESAAQIIAGLLAYLPAADRQRAQAPAETA